MKVHEILGEQQLNEITLKQAIAAGVVGTSLMSPLQAHAKAPKQPLAHHQAVDSKFKKMATSISKQYKVDPAFAEQVVRYAHKYSKPDFPTAKDILALVGVESSFDPSAVSALKKDPAIGLLQVRPGVWNMNPEDISDSIENQIRVGSNVLHTYYKHLKDKGSAVQAYNMGLTNFQRGRDNPAYLGKYQQELQRYAAI